MFSRQRRKAQFLFSLADSLLTLLAFFFAYETRVFLPLRHDFYLMRPVAVLLMLGSVALWIALGQWLEIYGRLETAEPQRIIGDTIQQCVLATVGLVLAEFFLRLDLSRFFLLSFAVTNTILLTLFRLRVRRGRGFIGRELAGPHYVLVVGSGERARRLAAELESIQPDGMRLLGFLPEPGIPFSPLMGERVYPMDQLPDLLRRHVIDEIIFAVGSDSLAPLEDIFLLCDEEGVRTRIAVDFFPHVNSDIYLDRLGASPLLTFSAAPHDEIRLLLKRLVDVCVAGVALAFALPFMLLIGVIIRLTSPGPAIFRQERCGLNGRHFTFYKFRSMVENAEALKASLAHLNSKELAFKIPNDPRLTPIGRYLRKFSIDEWPQFWNVLKGDMSLVGPRPAVPEEVERYERWQRRRLRMRPGLTCLWALNGRDHLDFDTWMKMDMQYIDNWSLALDCKILLQTIPSVLLGKGAH